MDNGPEPQPCSILHFVQKLESLYPESVSSLSVYQGSAFYLQEKLILCERLVSIPLRLSGVDYNGTGPQLCVFLWPRQSS